jgi:hypothetical protein
MRRFGFATTMWTTPLDDTLDDLGDFAGRRIVEIVSQAQPPPSASPHVAVARGKAAHSSTTLSRPATDDPWLRRSSTAPRLQHKPPLDRVAASCAEHTTHANGPVMAAEALENLRRTSSVLRQAQKDLHIGRSTGTIDERSRARAIKWEVREAADRARAEERTRSEAALSKAREAAARAAADTGAARAAQAQLVTMAERVSKQRAGIARPPHLTRTCLAHVWSRAKRGDTHTPGEQATHRRMRMRTLLLCRNASESQPEIRAHTHADRAVGRVRRSRARASTRASAAV